LIVLRPDLIKLDRSLTRMLPEDTVTRAMVESLVRFAARSGSAVCAEGIESPRLLEVVAELDIAYGQGFLFGEPRPGWTLLSDEATAAAVEVHRQALSGTPKQALFLDEFVLLERLADRFSEAEELEDVHHAVGAVRQLVGADDVAIDLVDSEGAQIERLSHHTWEAGPAETLDNLPLVRWALDTRRAAQVLVSDPNADRVMIEHLWQSGFGGLLLVPVITHGVSLGVLGFYRRHPVPWTLTQIRMARIGASQLAATLDRLLPARALGVGLLVRLSRSRPPYGLTLRALARCIVELDTAGFDSIEGCQRGADASGSVVARPDSTRPMHSAKPCLVSRSPLPRFTR
jgi:GAF domain-containing protein